eukprot:479715_1
MMCYFSFLLSFSLLFCVFHHCVVFLCPSECLDLASCAIFAVPMVICLVFCIQMTIFCLLPLWFAFDFCLFLLFLRYNKCQMIVFDIGCIGFIHFCFSNDNSPCILHWNSSFCCCCCVLPFKSTAYVLFAKCYHRFLKSHL